MTIFSLLFAFHGRIDRRRWWLGMAIVATAAAAAIIGIAILHMHPIFFLPSALLSSFPVFALGIKRLHDRDSTGWYIAWITVIPAMLLLLAGRVGDGSVMGWGLTSTALLLIVLGIAELGFRPGTDGVNEYDDASADETAPTFADV
jgi:uncharacterized membrane protein YhaH (DUF805 family)